MLGPGPLIAIYVVLLYAILGPLVLFVIYVFFDSLSRPDTPVKPYSGSRKLPTDPAVWTSEEIDFHMDQV